MYSIATLANIYKKMWPEGIEQLCLKGSPTMGLMPKMNKFFGDGKELAWRISNGGQASASFTVAQARTGQSVINKPLIKRKKLYITKEIDHESLEASENSSGAIIDLMKEMVTNATDELKRAGAQLIIGDHYNGTNTGCIGRIAPTGGGAVTTATVRLDDISQIRNFYPGLTVQAFNTVAVGLLDAGSTAEVLSINEQTGNITFTTHLDDAITGIAVGDYLVSEGNFLTVPMGLFGWNPATLIAVGAGDSFFTVDRGGSVAMQGPRYAPASGSNDEVAISALHYHNRFGGDHDTMTVNPVNFGNIVLQQSSLMRINQNAVASTGKKIADLSYEGVVIHGPKGKVELYSDEYMPLNKAKLYKRSSCEIWSMKEMFRLLTRGAPSDGLVREATADASEMRWGGYWNFVVKNPRDVCDITFPA
jgi:hypothetical protein